MPQREPAFAPTDPVCPRCLKPLALCVCDEVRRVANRTGVLILQHPQEQDKLLGTARLSVQQLDRATFRIGLSWPSLARALGRPAEPRRWAAVFLGSARPSDFPSDRDIAVFDRKGKAAPDQERQLADIEGIILLDGSWSQAKTLWWRNAWLLKCRRIALRPRRPSLYGKLRREPRREGLSTIEAAGMVLARLEKQPEIEAETQRIFARMLERYGAALSALPPRTG